MGNTELSSSIRSASLNWDEIWQSFRRTKAMLGAVAIDDCSSILNVLDPIILDPKGVHHALHQAMIKNEMLIVTMLVDAEAWEWARLIRGGGDEIPAGTKLAQ